ncbi:MAG: hypothetical protein M1819_000752 [Sarea resinae]|nr:MAG: hypothetical protein M1819_000752 [Sarea resinae]
MALHVFMRYSPSADGVWFRRSSSLSLTASLKAAQLTSSLSIIESNAKSIASRVLLQNALQRYGEGNNTDANWSRAVTDLGTALAAGGQNALVQAIIFPNNATGLGGPYGLLNVTSDSIPRDLMLPYSYPNGSNVRLGDVGPGYPRELYPNISYSSVVLNSTNNLTLAHVLNNTVTLYPNSTLLLGPLQINSSFALLSLTLPIINNTSATDVLGYATVIINAGMIYDIIDSLTGLDDTGIVLLVTPNTPDHRFPPGVTFNSRHPDKISSAYHQEVRFLLPPSQNVSRGKRHDPSPPPFQLHGYPAALDAFSRESGDLNNAGSLISTMNEINKSVSVGYALPQVSFCDWALLVEHSRAAVFAPIHHLRNTLVACVFGTAGGILVLVLPIAHLSVRPIRQLREATKRTVGPACYTPDHSSLRTTNSDGEPHSGDETAIGEKLKQEGLLAGLLAWRKDARKPRAQRKAERRKHVFRIPGKVPERKHAVKDELTDLTETFNEMSDELMMQYERLEERVKERTQELEISKKAAEAANESKTLFIANLSHELKTPLNGILGMCAVCMQEEDQTKIKRSLGIIYKSGDLLLHLLQDLLTFSKNQIGQQLSLDEKEFRLADISTQVLSIFDKQAQEGNIDVKVSFQGPFEPSQSMLGEKDYSRGSGRVKDMCLWGDQHRILQVIINLVSNSLKFTPPGGSVALRIKYLGEVEEQPNSRKASIQSRLSRQWSARDSRQSRNRSRMGSATSTSVSDAEKIIDVAAALDRAHNSKQASHVMVEERTSSPPPADARSLMFEFEVEDTGPGIPEHLQQRVFEPFVQGDLGLSRKFGGTGLGLSICTQLAGLMKGTITLHSQVGAGSTFSLRIPLKYTRDRTTSTRSSSINLDSSRNSIANESSMLKVEADDGRSVVSVSSTHGNANSNAVTSDPKPRLVGLSQPFFASDTPMDTPKQQMAAMERVAAEATKRGDRIRVLVAEDNKVNQEVVLRMLKLEDIYDVTVAKDGQEALDMVKESMNQGQLYNLIFMDIQMPNLDGLQSTRLIREIGYSAPIVALSAFAEESNVKECMDSGMDYFLAKPIRRPALKQVLKTYCPTIPEVEEVDGSAELHKPGLAAPAGDSPAVSPFSLPNP